MDRSLTYFDDVAAIKVSLQLMQKRSGVPLLRFTSTFKVPPFETLYATYPTYMLDVKPMSLQSGRVYRLRRTVRFCWHVNQLLRWTAFPLTEQARQISAKFT